MGIVPHPGRSASPCPVLTGALVIAGSDKRGTIYGIYDLSEQIGVSPWYWWADVPVAHKDALFVKPGKYVQGPPAVKYRGIFLNDEAPALTGWVSEKFGDYNHEFYTNVFELLLRLKANYLWPAMWNNCFNEDDPQNPKLADEYGIVMGTSHHEPMLRAEKEWNRKASRQRQLELSTPTPTTCCNILARRHPAQQELRKHHHHRHARQNRHAHVRRPPISRCWKRSSPSSDK